MRKASGTPARPRRRRRLRTLAALRPGRCIYQPGDTEPGVIVSVSYLGTHSSAARKWVWVRYGERDYVQILGSAALRALDIEEDQPCEYDEKRKM